ncbi:Arrestin domain-containing protein 17 [Eumeta japonica]|uniref:Arrestin domain-containing protein 17 n=1 Tax=Eumeta variegata TaxID=151549 RepID=A0A4C1UV54_EUMVA|nr:Arrestin domain-containing protein 17 [Eumeta japonica]
MSSKVGYDSKVGSTPGALPASWEEVGYLMGGGCGLIRRGLTTGILTHLTKRQAETTTLRIYVKIKGFAHVHWGTRHSKVVDGKTKSCTVNHDAHEDYFYMKQYLVGDEHGEHHLEAGDYSFDFQCVIPAHCPSSFEHKYGHIRYEIKIVLERASKFDHEKKVSIKVISPLDLNQDPYCKHGEPSNLFSNFNFLLLGENGLTT